MKYPVEYPKLLNISRVTGMPEMPLLWENFYEFARMKCEQGADLASLQKLVDEVEQKIRQNITLIMQLADDPGLEAAEPDDLPGIKALRPPAQRQLWNSFDKVKYEEKLAGAMIGRFAGCTLGAPVEFWSVEDMRSWAGEIGDAFPPVDYWSAIRNPNYIRYRISRADEYTRAKLRAVPVDDDITYTILGLLVLEDCGPAFTTADVAACWLRYLPYACTAEEVALNNLRAGIAPGKAAGVNNPYAQWIGADIRSDPWGYAAPGLPETAAEMAYYDATLSHRRNGIYGGMFFSAAIAAAFEADNAADALRAGLGEIPADCLLARDIRWALDAGKGIRDYRDARLAVEQRLAGMSGVHTNFNACLTVFALMIGGPDFTRVIGEAVAMGYDNDCNAATAGSIIGAILGIHNIPEKWYRSFNNRVLTYLNGWPELKLDALAQRFSRQAERVFNSHKE